MSRKNLTSGRWKTCGHGHRWMKGTKQGLRFAGEVACNLMEAFECGEAECPLDRAIDPDINAPIEKGKEIEDDLQLEDE